MIGGEKRLKREKEGKEGERREKRKKKKPILEKNWKKHAA